MTWSYRIIEHDTDPITGSWFGLHEVHYNRKRRPEGWSEDPVRFVCPGDEGVNGITEALWIAIKDATSRPVLKLSELLAAADPSLSAEGRSEVERTGAQSRDGGAIMTNDETREAIAKVLGWDVQYAYDGETPCYDVGKGDGIEAWAPLPDWPTDVGACFRDLVPWAEAKPRCADLFLDSACGWEASFRWFRTDDAMAAGATADDLWDFYVYQPEPGATPAEAICAAFLAAFGGAA